MEERIVLTGATGNTGQVVAEQLRAQRSVPRDDAKQAPPRRASLARDLVEGRTGGGDSFTPPDSAVIHVIQRVSPSLMRLRARMHARRNAAT